MGLSVTTTVSPDGGAVLSVRGEIDHGNADELRSAIQSVLASRRPHTVRLDLGLVTFLDSGAVGALVASHRMAAAEGAQLVVASTSPFVSRQLDIAGVADLLGAPHTTA
ncbi:STAS domain-containing protein [Virgisporangium aliadipatigenens]|uniref:STAS domain-containing protein n=1 Tax=Virgisporangium aliadipatigenens TaxID=741659 RepID=UPI0019425966|nr:STAS domain-containing protein [Virgisporangium aliadipatigenens]